jgi:hypothetical protein
VIAEHRINIGHHRDFSSTSMLYKATNYMDLLSKEIIEIRFNSRNPNREVVFIQRWT